MAFFSTKRLARGVLTWMFMWVCFSKNHEGEVLLGEKNRGSPDTKPDVRGVGIFFEYFFRGGKFISGPQGARARK